MFRHRGKSRTLSHNKQIASLLSFVAGIVSVAGFLSIERMTTNVTGHFAFFIDGVFNLEVGESFIFFFYILFFLLGSFVSNMLVELVRRKSERYIYVLPIIIESTLLFTVALLGKQLLALDINVIAYILLFAMGLQNSLVTIISDAIVRTTHLTGLFTDLGIELSQLFFYKTKKQRNRLITTIRLRLRIIIYFFVGGISGGVLYSSFQLQVLILPAVLLLLGLVYDSVKFKLLVWTDKHKDIFAN